jgi:hypothetical protein
MVCEPSLASSYQRGEVVNDAALVAVALSTRQSRIEPNLQIYIAICSLVFND